MVQAKEREELRTRLAKLTQNKESEKEEIEPVEDVEQEENLENLEAQFEARKKALLDKQKEQKTQENVSSDEEIKEAVYRLQNSGVFRFELMVQLVRINSNLEKLAEVLKK